MDGFLNMLKVPGMTSHDVVKYVRRLFPGVKVGHGGTLDPAAAGVLPLMLGKATRLSHWVLRSAKQYRVELSLGITTDTDDSTGTTLNRTPPPDIDEDTLKRLFKSFEGELFQIPPMFSAVKRQGKKMYQYAREGKEVERKQRLVNIYSMKLLDYFSPDRIVFEVHCSKGTYIRTLCRQIGDALGCGACMSFLLRTKAGMFYLKDAVPIENVEKRPGEMVLPLDFVFQGEKKLVLNAEESHYLCFGQKLKIDKLTGDLRQALPDPVDEKVLPVYTTEGEFVALARWEKVENGDYPKYVLVPEKIFKPNK